MEECEALQGLYWRIVNDIVYSYALYDDIHESEIGSATYSVVIPEEVLTME